MLQLCMQHFLYPILAFPFPLHQDWPLQKSPKNSHSFLPHLCNVTHPVVHLIHQNLFFTFVITQTHFTSGIFTVVSTPKCPVQPFFSIISRPQGVYFPVPQTHRSHFMDTRSGQQKQGTASASVLPYQAQEKEGILL